MVGHPLAQVIFTDENDIDSDIRFKIQKVIQITSKQGYGHSDLTTNAPNAIAKQLSTIFGGSQAAADNKIKITDSNDSAAGVYNSDNNNALAQESQVLK